MGMKFLLKEVFGDERVKFRGFLNIKGKFRSIFIIFNGGENTEEKNRP